MRSTKRWIHELELPPCSPANLRQARRRQAGAPISECEIHTQWRYAAWLWRIRACKASPRGQPHFNTDQEGQHFRRERPAFDCAFQRRRLRDVVRGLTRRSSRLARRKTATSCRSTSGYARLQSGVQDVPHSTARPRTIEAPSWRAAQAAKHSLRVADFVPRAS